MAVDPFASSRYSLRHAKRRLDEVELALVQFVDAQPYHHVVEPNVEGPFKTHKIKLRVPFPDVVAGAVFDAVNALRSSLDQAGYSVAVGAGRSGNHAHFPFGDNDKASATCHIWGRSKDIPQEVFDRMVDFKPYKTGNRVLWAVNELCNTSKHEVIVHPTPTPQFMLVRWRQYMGIEPVKWPPVWDRVNNEMVIARTPLDSHDKVQFNGSFDICIHDIQGFAGKAAVPLLRRMFNQTLKVLASVEKMSVRFGYTPEFPPT